ncbi:hypothetical protein RRG08_002204 [Elysia crispata]|uniref:Uncharacterized protein n=1 Tax=Elysia crispata TaxID=231223 RepID=A0AAE1DCZ3_9GAST|nr:hypothetical protein RRG08_002204 [Elysia crispata]
MMCFNTTHHQTNYLLPLLPFSIFPVSIWGAPGVLEVNPPLAQTRNLSHGGANLTDSLTGGRERNGARTEQERAKDAALEEWCGRGPGSNHLISHFIRQVKP